ncbi:hypothetical protein V6Z12_D11G131000 [Gossypium hirsutum]
MPVSNPYGTSSHEHWDKLVLHLEGHDLIGTPNELLPYENSWYTGLASHLLQCPFNLLPILDFVQLVNCWICPKPTYQCLDGMAHATCGPAKDHHWSVSYHPCNCFHYYATEKKKSTFKCVNVLWSFLGTLNV